MSDLSESSNNDLTASFGLRLSAMLLEYTVIFTLYLAVLPNFFKPIIATLDFIIYTVIFTILIIIYFILWECSHFQTSPAKMLFGLDILDTNGQPASWFKILLRSILKNVIIILGVIGFYFVYSQNFPWLYLIPVGVIIFYNIAGVFRLTPAEIKGQTLYDHISGTIVSVRRGSPQFMSAGLSILISVIVLLPIIIFQLILVINTIYYAYDPCANKASLVFVKKNMYSLQRIVDIYAEKSKGLYPSNVLELKKHAIEKKYWEKVVNPFNKKKEIRNVFIDYKNYKSSPEFIGVVLYQPIGTPPKSYRIYGCDCKGKQIEFFKGNTFFLSK